MPSPNESPFPSDAQRHAEAIAELQVKLAELEQRIGKEGESNYNALSYHTDRLTNHGRRLIAIEEKPFYPDRPKDGEPSFTLLARDPLAPIVVELWASMREHVAGNPSQVTAARECATKMRQWLIASRASKAKP